VLVGVFVFRPATIATTTSDSVEGPSTIDTRSLKNFVHRPNLLP